MFLSFILALASIFTTQGEVFFSQDIELPAGESQIVSNDYFNAVSLVVGLDETVPELNYSPDGLEFVPWEVDDDRFFEVVYFPELRKKLKIKSSNSVKLTAHFFNTQRKGEDFVALAQDDPDYENSILMFAPELAIAPPKFITREEWGANEDLRVWKKGKFTRFFSGVFNKKWFEKESEKVKKIFRPKIIQEKNEKGEPLFWPIAESPKIQKVVIHHTGENVLTRNSKRSPKEIMRAIYYYHTITRGWGDIGYNYVIDKNGNIYEGRKGGPKAVGAHVAYHNIGTIGISLMGNFNQEKPTSAQLKVLAILLADHSERFDIDLMGSSTFLGIDSANITGHTSVTRAGHGTSCPGKYLIEKLPEIREAAVEISKIFSDRLPKGLDFLSQSTEASKYRKDKKFVRPVKQKVISLASIPKKQILARQKKTNLEVEMTNGTDFIWPEKSKITIFNIPEGITITPFRAIEKIRPGRSGVFRASILTKDIPNGDYDLELFPDFLRGQVFAKKIEKLAFVFPIEIHGGKRATNKKFVHERFTTKLAASSFSTTVNDQKIEKITKIKLAFFDQNFADIRLESTSFILNEKGEKVLKVSPESAIKVSGTSTEKLKVNVNGKNFLFDSLAIKTDGILEIRNYDRGLSKTLKYNKFRKKLSFYPQEERKLLIINELPIESYLAGLAEEPSTEPEQKKHAIHILARSYAYVYSGTKRKFRTKLYDLEDDPASSQFYLGYEWEKYHADQRRILKETRGLLLTFKNEPVIGPYFTQSAGESSDKWQKAYPWTKKQKLPFDEGLQQRGHGVGLSGNSARELAKNGNNYEQILKYFFNGVSVKKVY
jgi:hypothetical protein